MKIDRNIVAAGRDLELVITTQHEAITVMTGVHRITHPRRQGGVRFVNRGSIEELAHLAHGMTEKCAAARVPLDGMKALVICPDGIPSTFELRAQLLQEHIRQAATIDRGLVFGPDMGCPEEVLDLVAQDPDLLANVTGLSRAQGGLDIDKNGLTAFGVATSLRAVLGKLTGMKVAIQGFGNVGAHLALLLAQDGVLIVGVSNVASSLVDEGGLDARTLHALWTAEGDACLEAYTGTGRTRRASDPSRLFDVATDIFVPAARTSVLACAEERGSLATENPEVRPIEDYLLSSGVKIIAEAANHPLSYAAERYAESRGVLVLPDIIINCGGMIGCWYEYEQRECLRRDPAAYDAGLAACRSLISERIQQNLSSLRVAGAAAARGQATASAAPLVAALSSNG